MVRINSYSSSGSPRISSTPKSGVNPGAKGLGKAQTLLLKLYANQKEQERAEQIAKGKLDAMKAAKRASSTYSNRNYTVGDDGTISEGRSDTDPLPSWNSAVKGYEQHMATQKAAALGGITDKKARLAVEMEWERQTILGSTSVAEAALKGQNDEMKATLRVVKQEAMQEYVDAKTDNQRAAIVQNFTEFLFAGHRTGAWDKENVVKEAQAFRNDVTALQVRQDLLTATNSPTGSRRVLDDLRSGEGYEGLNAESRQHYEEVAMNQWEAAVNYQFRMEERRERLDVRKTKKLQEERTRELSGLIRYKDEYTGALGTPKIGHVEIDRAFQSGEISAPQANYLRALIDYPEPNPHPTVRAAIMHEHRERAYRGELDFSKVLNERARGNLFDQDVDLLDNLNAAALSSGGAARSKDAKAALDFATKYAFGIDVRFDVRLEDDETQRLAIMELTFDTRVLNGENPYSVALDLIEEDASTAVNPSDIPDSAQDVYGKFMQEGKVINNEFWESAAEAIRNADTTTTIKATELQTLRRLQQKEGQKLQRLEGIRGTLKRRATMWDNR